MSNRVVTSVVLGAIGFSIGCAAARFQRSLEDQHAPKMRTAQDRNEAAAQIAPVTLRYRGRHEGDHPTVPYEAIAEVHRTSRGDVDAWVYTSSWSIPGIEQPNYFIEAAIAADDGRPLDQSLRVVAPFPTFSDALAFEGPTIRARFTTEAHETSASATAPPGTTIAGGVYTLDLLIAARMLGPDFREDVLIADRPSTRDAIVLRPFTLRVAGEETLNIADRAVKCWVLEIEPRDDSERFRSTWHIPQDGPRYAVRKRYVFNPVTDAYGMRSIGFEELISIERRAP